MWRCEIPVPPADTLMRNYSITLRFSAGAQVKPAELEPEAPLPQEEEEGEEDTAAPEEEQEEDLEMDGLEKAVAEEALAQQQVPDIAEEDQQPKMEPVVAIRPTSLALERTNLYPDFVSPLSPVSKQVWVVKLPLDFFFKNAIA